MRRARFPASPFSPLPASGYNAAMMSPVCGNTQLSSRIELKDPTMAAFLAWLVPGLGHWVSRAAAGLKPPVLRLQSWDCFAYGV